ncbi:uncharacterized protein LOC134820695 [Bolinopsis microptera]|uniref:uncharacterized protein LOC134820695 n=1 Tax=Bolinopsis microptera TaxID=2820187 RepID=UPI003078A9FC
MTRSSALTQAVSRAECTPEQKHQRVIDWLNEVHKVLYKNLDLSKHSIKLHVREETEKDKIFPKQAHAPVHRLYTQADHENIRNNNCNRAATREKPKLKEQNKSSGNQLPSIPKRHFSSSNSSQPTTFQRKSSGQVTTRPPITSRVIRTTKQQQPVSKPVLMSTTPRKPTTTFTRTGRLRSSAPITAG